MHSVIYVYYIHIVGLLYNKGVTCMSFFPHLVMPSQKLDIGEGRNIYSMKMSKCWKPKLFISSLRFAFTHLPVYGCLHLVFSEVYWWGPPIPTSGPLTNIGSVCSRVSRQDLCSQASHGTKWTGRSRCLRTCSFGFLLFPVLLPSFPCQLTPEALSS